MQTENITPAPLDINQLSKEEKARLLEELRRQEEEDMERKKEEKLMLKQMTDETIKEVFGGLMMLSEQIAAQKSKVYDSFAIIMELKKQVYDRPEAQNSDTFTTSDGKLRIILGYNEVDDYDDTVNIGVEKVREFISSLGRDENSRLLVSGVMKLLARDQKGNLKASRVMQLAKMADESGNKDFQEAVKIIRDAHRPVRTKSYIIAKHRDPETNEWKGLALSITEA